MCEKADSTPVAAFDAESFLASLTSRPGVYQMLDKEGETLYVGKARNLRNRVTGYFRAAGLSAKTIVMIAQVADIQVMVTASETEALLLEQNLIKSARPRYNVVLRDDKSYPYVYLTAHEEFASLKFYRGARPKRGRLFGPYPSTRAVRESITVLQKLFRIRQCEDSFFKNRSRPCLQHQIGRCSAPCVGLITADDYASDLGHAVLFLEGRNEEIMVDLQSAMETASRDLDFERAAIYRDRIRSLAKVRERQSVIGGSGDIDVVAIARTAEIVCVTMVFIRAGRVIGQRSWFPQDQLGREDGDLLAAFLAQYYLEGWRGKLDVPQEIVLAQDLEDRDLLSAAIAARSKRRVRISVAQRGRRKRWVELALAGARQGLQANIGNRRKLRERFLALQDGLRLEATPQRLECFDVSHTFGDQTVASCVVFDADGPLKSDYRRFNIDDITPGDDYAAMRQALHRRYLRVKENDGQLPDILFIDGGKGQLTQARQVLDELQVDAVLIIGIAKGPTRKAGLETLINSCDNSEIQIRDYPQALHLIQYIRDEAHRFAITGHRGRRARARRQSRLDAISGIGAQRKRDLLKHFGGISGIRNASVEDLIQVPGISRKLAEKVHAYMYGN